MTDQKRAGTSSIGKHLISFVVMILLTAVAFYLVMSDTVAATVVIPIIIGLAVIQVILQLYIFMHLDQKGSLMPTIFMFFGLVIGVISAVGILIM